MGKSSGLLVGARASDVNRRVFADSTRTTFHVTYLVPGLHIRRRFGCSAFT